MATAPICGFSPPVITKTTSLPEGIAVKSILCFPLPVEVLCIRSFSRSLVVQLMLIYKCQVLACDIAFVYYRCWHSRQDDCSSHTQPKQILKMNSIQCCFHQQGNYDRAISLTSRLRLGPSILVIAMIRNGSYVLGDSVNFMINHPCSDICQYKVQIDLGLVNTIQAARQIGLKLGAVNYAWNLKQ